MYFAFSLGTALLHVPYLPSLLLLLVGTWPSVRFSGLLSASVERWVRPSWCERRPCGSHVAETHRPGGAPVARPPSGDWVAARCHAGCASVSPRPFPSLSNLIKTTHWCCLRSVLSAYKMCTVLYRMFHHHGRGGAPCRSSMLLEYAEYEGRQRERWAGL